MCPLTSYPGHGGKGVHARVMGCPELASRMVSLVVWRGKGVGPQNGLCPSQHIAHGLFVVLVGKLVIDQELVPGIYRCLRGIAYFSNGAPYDLVAAIGVACGYLRVYRCGIVP